MTEVGQSTLALGALKAVANGLLAEITGAAKGVAKRSIGKLQAEFGIGFAQYVERNKKRCGLVKTLLHRVDPIPINNAYVDPAFELQRRELLGENFAESLTELKNIIIVGSGGAGKSIFIKRLFLSFCENPFGRIPIFVELRDLNQKDSRDLFVHIY